MAEKKTKKKIVRKKRAGEKKPALNEKQEMFCRLYASHEEFFGNGIQSYARAYNIDLESKGGYGTAKVNACKLLTKPNILKRIDELFEAHGLNDTFVDKQLEKMIVQDADFKTKLGAIKEYNLLKKRVSNKIIDIPEDSSFSVEIEVKKNEDKMATNRKTSGSVEQAT
jgi:hypothetical protein